ncbi:helix-turn-helix transcriptional regulator [Ruminococcus sp.]|uniref:helix-turn-helix domain-containing protein n=1 Tax=Ruminococcus sp. TaxID=41978 RepID=UPI0034462846|nr:helix-turn-helix transcriptional regulator [Ruminococcus sp.]
MGYYPRIKDLREDKDLKQKDLAIILKTSQKQYSRWETGEYPIPFETVIILARFYNVSIDYIAGLTNNKGGIGCDMKSEYNISSHDNSTQHINK